MTKPHLGTDLTTQLHIEFQNLLKQAQAKIHHCVCQLNHEQLWWKPATGMNSIANLMLHVSGNLQQWVVDGICDRPNDRDRSVEFSATGDRTDTELLRDLDDVVDAAMREIGGVSENDWLQPRHVQGFQVTVLRAITHSVPHFVGHTHQIVQLARLQLGTEYRMHWQPGHGRGNVPI
jgi:Protein of unknown function (DUF1572)